MKLATQAKAPAHRKLRDVFYRPLREFQTIANIFKAIVGAGARAQRFLTKQGPLLCRMRSATWVLEVAWW